MTSLPAIASFKDFAAIAKFKPSYVTQLKGEGRLVLTDDGKAVRVAESMQRIEDTKDPSKIGVQRRHAAARESKIMPGMDVAENRIEIPVPDWKPLGDDPNEDVAGTQSIRRDIAAEELREKRRKNDEAEGKLLDYNVVAGALQSAVVTLRTRLEALPHTLAPALVVVTDEAKARALITSEVELALNELSRQFGAIAREAA